MSLFAFALMAASWSIPLPLGAMPANALTSVELHKAAKISHGEPNRASSYRRTISMDLQLAGKKALVTGSTRGIGLAIAERLALEGAEVAIGARSSDTVNDTVKALEAKGAKAWGRSVDVKDATALR